MSELRLRVTVVVEHQGNILLIKERNGEEAFYSLPGGSVEFLESIPEATQREVWEETGLLVHFERLLWVDERIDQAGEGKHTVGVGVLAKLAGEETTPIPGGVENEEILWTGWVRFDDFQKLPIYHDQRQQQIIKALSDSGYRPAYIGNIVQSKGAQP
ncbi:NUDIX domain-containing protein [Brevibacillus fulvus]|uniref:ADP-ribose pyrophosphatase YjhB (NUDIX family) n=1 Tax=Brevibacillus fulvus TaxID=1125967 RepID=A0A938XZE1_9BACL|nr:NUDIX hydrolase [Brevibacillus fulvus]MBM7591024.1 ADP-ribose pyrophosphatase YjhB (NUDIX family) [Brevibacillus fulvus]